LICDEFDLELTIKLLGSTVLREHGMEWGKLQKTAMQNKKRNMIFIYTMLGCFLS
jgi:hypothetical protein